MENSNSLGSARIALLIDFDNVILGIDDPGFDIELVVNALRERGTIVVSRVYGDWYRHNRHRRKLMEHGVELVEAPAFGPVIKNSADIKIALDGYEIGMTMPHINTFCLVSGDSDFLPLIKKLQSLGKNVLVICGNRFTSDMLRRNCNEFISYENLLAASYGADEDATTLDGAFALLHRAMAALRERGSEIRTSTLKQMMIQLNPVFSEKTFGYNQFRGFLDKAGRENLIKLGPRDRVSGEFYVLLPEEDEAEVIEQIERAEPAEFVEEIVESRRGGRGRRSERGGDNRNNDNNRNDNDGRDNRRGEVPAPVETETDSPRVSRREARLQALREQEELEQQAPASAQVAAPLATPLTPATDFSPANADEVREKSMARAELLARGMHVGKVKFSGKVGRAERIENTETKSQSEEPVVEPDIALALEDVRAEDGDVAMPNETPAPEAASESEEATEKPKRSRSRRRRKTTEAPAEETAPPETATASDESAPISEATAGDEAQATPIGGTAAPVEASANDEVVPTSEVTAQVTTEEAPAEKKTRRRRTSRKKTEETAAEATTEPTAESAATAAEPTTAEPTAAEPTTEASIAEADGEEKPKSKRTRRRKKTEETAETDMEKAVQPDGTPQTVPTESLIEASAGTPAATAEEKPKTRRRRTSRKQAEEKADAQAAINENIVTTDDVSQKELAQMPVPISKDEL